MCVCETSICFYNNICKQQMCRDHSHSHSHSHSVDILQLCNCDTHLWTILCYVAEFWKAIRDIDKTESNERELKDSNEQQLHDKQDERKIPELWKKWKLVFPSRQHSSPLSTQIAWVFDQTLDHCSSPPPPPTYLTFLLVTFSCSQNLENPSKEEDLRRFRRLRQMRRRSWSLLGLFQKGETTLGYACALGRRVLWRGLKQVTSK